MHWKFYGRKLELDSLYKLLTQPRWFFCAISGRRRIGKTSLIREALHTLPRARKAIYLQVPISSPADTSSSARLMRKVLPTASHRAKSPRAPAA